VSTWEGQHHYFFSVCFALQASIISFCVTGFTAIGTNNISFV